METCIRTGHPVMVWSGFGDEHAKMICERFGLSDLVDAYLTKPGHPFRYGQVVDLLGCEPYIQYDDDGMEFPDGADWYFIKTNAYEDE